MGNRNLAVILAGTALVIFLLFFSRSCIGLFLGQKPPDTLSVARVVAGESLFDKRVFYKSAMLGMVTDIKQGELDSAPGEELGIAGSAGAVFLDADWKVTTRASFWSLLGMLAPSASISAISLVDVDNDGVSEFLGRGSWLEPVVLFDHSGKKLWSYKDESGVDDAAAGDMDGDGVAEIAVGFNGGGGVHLLNAKGEKLWRVPDGNVWHVEIADTDGDGTNEIVHSNARGQLTVRDSKGEILIRKWVPNYFSQFSLTKVTWLDDGKTLLPLYVDDEWVRVLDYDDEVLVELDAPYCDGQGDAYGTLVDFGGEAGLVFAVVVDYLLWNRAILYMYDAVEANLVYQEIIGSRAASVAAIPARNGEGQVLLVGGVGKVWEYSPKE